MNHSLILEKDISTKWKEYSNLPRFSLESTESFEILETPLRAEGVREQLRGNIRTINDIAHSSSEDGRDNGNGLIVQNRSSLPPLRLRLTHPEPGNVLDNLNDENRADNICTNSSGVSLAPNVIPTNNVVSHIRQSSFHNSFSEGNVEASNRSERGNDNFVGTIYENPRNSTLLNENSAPPAFNPDFYSNLSNHIPSSNSSTPSPFLRAEKYNVISSPLENQQQVNPLNLNLIACLKIFIIPN